MIQKISHTAVFVLDQDSAKSFYCDKLGFEVRTDARMGDFRWLTVSPKGQKELELILMALRPGPMMGQEAIDAIRALLQKGQLGAGVLETDDCRKTYEELSKKGVQFMGPPEERPYGIEALVKDDSGNWWSMVQRPR